MESLTLVNNALVKSVSVNAVAATKVAGVRISKPSRAIHTTPMTTTSLKVAKKAAFSQSKTYATAPCITNDAAAKSEIDVEGWIKKHYTPYEGDGSFLAGPTEKTKKLFAKAEEYLAKERANGGLYDVDPHTPSTITSHKPGYLDKENEVIYGYQTDVPLKRAIKPFGGVNMVKNALKAVNVPMDKEVEHIFTDYRKTHNTAVFDIYSKEMRAGRSNAIMTGLPDGYGRGRIIGDYRRVALYGTDRLIAQKQKDKEELQKRQMDEPTMKLIGEVADQIKALKQLTQMAKSYGIDISKPAKNAREATQFVYFGYLGSIKEQDGAAMSLGRVDAFLDCFFENDLKNGVLDEAHAQEIVDNLILKLRFARHLRTPEYNDLFAGDPTWVTMSLGGTGSDGRTLVTKTSFRVLNTLYNLGPAPEPNITVLWNKNLPKNFKDFATKVSIDTSSIQYESDALMSARFGDDYGIACCVSAMRIGKDMQFFGARCNLAKLMLYVLNHGKDERTGKQVGPDFGPVPEGPIPFDWMWETYDKAMDWIAKLYVNTMNVIHFCHDQYCYESLQMALHDTDVRRLMAFGVAGLSVVADSFSAIKYAKVTPIRDPKTGLTTDFKIEGEFPKFGNDDDRVDFFARTVTDKLITKLRKTPTYRGAIHTLSILTITSNVVYGKKTGSTPDGRKAGQPFAPGCNPMHGREFSGAVASLSSVAKVNYDSCMDGISNTFSIVPNTIGKTLQERQGNLSGLLDGYFSKGAHHLNVNVLKRETLEDAMAHPENYPNLTIRVSGYAVNFVKLTPAQQKEVIARTFHEKM
ncbi:formate C-acetyltransferase [Neocallimastix californiae]|uniref:formate C-acetyltransferase n=1 Tax=Neocallimastix californiae TaxID=1754190 RepID=A0A1Y2BZ83_9FUNG|nr:formate C-acetyltransferase [Neocallimastix californiae]|eukprot:ORY40036.1 formate C-acetyltransferase [Neocallimastix californiae]